MAEATPENQPLNREVSLRFPDGSFQAGGDETGGFFDGNNKASYPVSYLTRKGDYEAPIPEPPLVEVEEAARKGVDADTGRITQPPWLSVLKKRQRAFFFIRWALCNCFCNPRFTMTRAQWIWFVNLAALAFNVYYTVVIYMEAIDKPTTAAMEVTIWRIQTMWNATAGGDDGFSAILVDNKRPIRIDVLLNAVFLLMTLWYLYAVALGPFDRWIWIYWRQLDICFHWWSWAQLSATLPMLVMIVCLLTNLREQNSIATCFVLMASFVGCNALTELWSRPYRNTDRSYDMNRWTGDELPVKPGEPWTRLSPEEICQRSMQQGRRRMNYVARLMPTVLSIIPFVTVWVIILNNFFVQLEDLRVDPTDEIYKRTPVFVPIAVIGTLVFTAGFLFPLIWWQWVPPQHYWKKDITYTILSFGTTFFLGHLVYRHVLMKDSFNVALALDQNTTAVA